MGWPGGGGGGNGILATAWPILAIIWLSHTAASKNYPPLDAQSFHFTHHIYNASITENAVPKTYVEPDVKMGIYLSDPTVDIRYKIISGDEQHMFKPDAVVVGNFCFLRLRLRSNTHIYINREIEDEYVFVIRAVAKDKDGPSFSAQTTVYVHVLDVNDLSPLFMPTSYRVDVREDTPVHHSVIQVTATDADIGMNGDVYYSLQEKTQVFAIHPTSGVVTLTRGISYMEQNSYRLNILAKDRGPTLGRKKRMETAVLEVRVIEVNSHSPTIDLQELPAVVEHGNKGTIYAILYVHDKDYGNNGKISSVSILAGDPHGFFLLRQGSQGTEYSIVVDGTLDREEFPSGFNLTIQANDAGSPQRSTRKVVHVKLADTNDQVPRFEKEHYTMSIEECVPVHSPLLIIRAEDRDIRKNAEIMYTINQGNDLGWFSIHTYTGLITVTSPLDTETAKLINLTIRGQDQGNRGSRKTSFATLSISIEDCNDNSPIFNTTSPQVYIEENQPSGMQVFQVAAYDLDQEDNGYLSYSIANEADTPFDIDHFTGKITTKEVLDYETMKRVYNLRIRASDWGTPFRRESEMVLKIRLRNQNDNKPQFEKVDCTGYLSKRAPIGTKLTTVSAIDFDQGGIISYRFVNNDYDDCFELSSSTGIIRTTCDFTRRAYTFLRLPITASDGVNSADPTTVNITFVDNNRNLQLAENNANFNCRYTDAMSKLTEQMVTAEQNKFDEDITPNPEPSAYLFNNHAPRFAPESSIQFSVPENVPVGHKIWKYNVTDSDPGYNGRVMFVIASGNEGGMFKLGTYTGDLTVMSPLDRETRSKYIINITAMDMGEVPRYDSLLVEISIADFNDHAPVFKKPSYAISVSEVVMINATVLQVVAEDEDQAENARIKYSILTDTLDFRIHPDTGMVQVNRALDREKVIHYELVVQAKDCALEHALSSTVTVGISVSDVNDNSPNFELSVYSIRIREDLPLGTVVLTISATDPDLGGGGIIRYNLQDGTDGRFEVDRETGTIRIIESLDYEKKQVYNITARARDRGEKPLVSKCIIIVEILDVNENLYTPRFYGFYFTARVSENMPRNTQVIKMGATDMDMNNPSASKKDYEIGYSIRDGSGMGFFSIHSDGTIVTNKVLDRETKSSYWLTVYAQDKGAIPLSSWVSVLVEVTDVNDNIPQTFEPVYTPSVLENSPSGRDVVTLQATDLDDEPNNNITYQIVSGNPQSRFQINKFSGLITTTDRKLDREAQEEHILEVRVTDSGRPRLSSTTRVVVTINDENDNPPKFTERMYKVMIPATPETSIKMPLYRVVASDPDTGDRAEIDYSIEGKANGRFDIDAKSGVISSNKEFVARSDYDITVAATDNGRPQRKTTTRVLFQVVSRPLHSPNAPVFLERHKTINVLENFRVGEMVELVIASDPDKDRVWYSIVGGNDGDKFMIDPVAGNIVLARTLDWETRTRYNLTIQASDGAHYVFCNVIVNVQDIEDNRPEFTNAVYYVNVRENIPVGANVTTVTATDNDHDKRLFYTIHAATDQGSLGKFRINSETDRNGFWKGVITTKEMLNREAIARHELTIMVRDQGTPSKRSLARVVITVQDHNDHAPEFLAARFEGRVFETAEVGTNVVEVMAMDRDVGQNAEIQYSIVSGNIGNAFAIEPTLGTITLAKPISKQKQDAFNLVVKATDRGHVPLSTTAPVHIQVTMADNAPPRFQAREYTGELRENQAEGTYITAVMAISRSSVVYEIQQGDDNDFFNINPNSGIITSNMVFDYEVASFYNLTVQAANMVGVTADTMVLVHIIDENDNKPIFTQEEYFGTISEASMAESNILDNTSSPLVIKATDMDNDRNALLIYDIEDSNKKDIFEIDTNTGAIRSKATLDHEVDASHSFVVQVMDMGSPRQTAEVAAMVTIHVLDVNDSPPQFTEKTYYADLLLPTFKDVAITTVSATDADWEVNSTLVYSIESGNEDGHFEIDAYTGEVMVILPGSMRDFYRLRVRVSDGVFENLANVDINVKMSVNSGLEFQQEYYAEIMEEHEGVEQVAVVQASGHDLNENLIFRIMNSNEKFQIGSTSGVVQTAGEPFDREKRDNYTLVIEVRDERTPARIAHGLLHVHILDYNDNAPLFVNKPYYAVVSIDAPIGEHIKKVTALDMDIGENGEVEYSLLDAMDGTFRINSKTGMISLRRRLNSDDENRIIDLNVVATDKAQYTSGGPRSTVIQVPVQIMNKATPIFSDPFYSVSIPENIPMHSAILSVEAKSPSGKKLIYSISSGNIYGEFAVDFNTDMEVLGPCSITVVDELDYETRTSYELAVRATDINTGQFAEAIVHVILTDVNDHAPSFASHHYTTTVSEAVTLGTSILAVTATDQDSEPNAGIHYHIQPNYLDSQYFHIDSNKGIILTKQKLDHEHQTQLSFKVIATDTGVPAMSASVIVKVLVTDLNDNAPKYDQLTYKVTITDLAKRGQFVTMVTASDEDRSDQGHLAYSIVGGNEKQAFAIEDNSGIISLSSLRSPDLLPNYMLNVSVTDGVFVAFARVLVTVRNSNSHAPMFTHIVYDFDHAENLPAGYVATVQANDADEGMYGEVTYEIESEDALEYFSIHAETGILTTKHPLDREQQAQFMVPVIARDGGGRAGYCTVRINVADQGDQKPQFHMAQYQVNIYETAQPGAMVLQVSADDRDLGSNGDLNYILYNGQSAEASEYFDINRDTGKVTLKRRLQGREDTSFQFFVRAADKGSPPNEADVPVEIYVMGVANYPPKFDKEDYTYFINEDKEVGSHVAAIAARSNETLTHSIIPGQLPVNNNPKVFGINDDGSILLLSMLDREDIELFELTIKAETETSPSLVAYSHVTIQIQDVNDNPPVFESNPYTVNVAENADIGSQVVQVIASDSDNGANAEVSYDFAPGYSKLSNIFAINSETGWITTLVTLDRESRDSYTFDVMASDRGSPHVLTDITTVKVRVTDHNDEPPVFTKREYNGAMNEDAMLGTVVLTVYTTDLDLGINAEVTYYITNGDILGQFGIQQTGDIFVEKKLDREQIPEYDLTVAATDGAFVATVHVKIVILDDNDNAPVCMAPMGPYLISENSATGTLITTVKATDADEANTRNSRLEYSLTGDDEEVFMMHEDSGIISTRKLLDREIVAEYRLIVRATDGGGLFCEVEVFITITDVNDNAPVFTMHQYVENIPEDAEIGTLLTRVSASDADLGINRKVRYAMHEGDAHFRIDAVSGIVSLKKPLDRESQPMFNLTIYAYDQGTPKMTSMAYLVVHLLDINDNPPEFELSTYMVTVAESAEIGESVVPVFATSKDSGINAEISYGIMAGNELGKFSIHSKTGLVSLKQPLDYEMSREYFLTIQATDRGMPPLSNTAVLRINVTDFNDNSPMFAQEEYIAQIREDASEETVVIQVHATDVDSAPNAKITYYIVNGDPLHQFGIQSAQGVVHVKGILDRETTRSYSLEIHAIDSGSPQLTGKTILQIELLDVNDCPPQFSHPNYTAVMQVTDGGIPAGLIRPGEDQELGHVVLALEVTDDDLEPNGAPFSFDIIEGNKDFRFRINRDGIITTAAEFNRHIRDTFKLTVRVFDNGTPPLYTDVVVTVKLIEESAFPPKVTPLSSTITVDGDVFKGGVIGRLNAEDSDPYDSLRYDIVSNNAHLFGVDPSTGVIQALQMLDAGTYRINISISDGKFVVYSEVQLDIEPIIQEMAENSVVLRFKDITPEKFVQSYRDKFVQTLSHELATRNENNIVKVFVLSIQPASDDVVTPMSRQRRDAPSNDLDVLIAVRKSNNSTRSYYKGNSLRRKITSAKRSIENNIGVVMLEVFNEVCGQDFCDNEAICQTVVIFNTDKMTPIITDKLSYVTATHQMSYVCKCKAGYGGPLCTEEVDLCNPNPCPPPRHCKPAADDTDFICECPTGRSGPDCEHTLIPCTDPSCEGQPMSFSGNSFAAWHITVPMERRLALALSIKTVQTDARIMHSIGQLDYSILEIKDGMVQYSYDLGSGEGVARVGKIFVNDGYWHTVTVERSARHVIVIVDNQYSAEGRAPASNELLNLNSNIVYFGGEVEQGDRNVKKGFIGCMKDIQIDDEALLYSESSSVGFIQRTKNIDYNCQLSVSDICSNKPCLNGGLCIPLERCQGTCNDKFVCKCPEKRAGKRCETVLYCEPNPCQHESICLEGIAGPICKCDKYVGELCEFDVNECLNNPCENGAKCINSHGDYKCNCTSPATAGKNCEEVLLTPIKSSALGIDTMEIIWIAVVVGAILVVVLIVIITIRCRRQQKQRERERISNENDGATDPFLSNDEISREKQRNKMNSHNLAVSNNTAAAGGAVGHTPNIPPPSPRPQQLPPPLPARPVSYTPSNAESMNTLNNCNFDNARDYGSAADELESMGRMAQPIAIPEFLTNVDVDKSVDSKLLPKSPPPPPRKLHSQKLDPNYAENYPDNVKRQNKLIPADSNQSLQLLNTTLGTSAISLPESEDDLQENHKPRNTKGYHWDTSDWHPAAVTTPQLPGVTYACPDRHYADSSLPLAPRQHRPTGKHPPTSSGKSQDDINAIINSEDDYALTDYPDEEYDGNESEYVGDSEYPENEFTDNDDDGFQSDFPNDRRPSFTELLGTERGLHHYLPSFEPDIDTSHEHMATEMTELNGNIQAAINATAAAAAAAGPEADKQVLHYGFPKPTSNRRRARGMNRQSMISNDNRYSGDWMDFGDGENMIDDMSVSVGGYASTNASMSDINIVCDIEDSEANLSDYDSGEDNAAQKLNTLQTIV